ncbi:YHS domain-containing protein [Halogranum amylolyticum]|nr:YHS domain-containing protein [Halogranum amylolyticum]
MPTDPVCGMQIAISDAATSVQYGGVTYYFCSDECRQRFEDQPAVYTK